MSVVALTHLIPIQELTAGEIANLRNSAINGAIAEAAKALNTTPDKLVVRDIRPYTDLGLNYGTASAGTADNWLVDCTLATVGFVSVTGAETMADNRWVCIFGIRKPGAPRAAVTASATEASVDAKLIDTVSLIRVNVGGADKVIWDSTVVEAYPDSRVAFTHAPVLIPQNVTFNISYYYRNIASVSTAKLLEDYIELIGVTVEPRGKTISP